MSRFWAIFLFVVVVFVTVVSAEDNGSSYSGPNWVTAPIAVGLILISTFVGIYCYFLSPTFRRPYDQILREYEEEMHMVMPFIPEFEFEPIRSMTPSEYYRFIQTGSASSSTLVSEQPPPVFPPPARRPAFPPPPPPAPPAPPQYEMKTMFPQVILGPPRPVAAPAVLQPVQFQQPFWASWFSNRPQPAQPLHQQLEPPPPQPKPPVALAMPNMDDRVMRAEL